MPVEPFLGTRAQRFFIGAICIQAIAVLAIISIVFHFVDEHVDLGHVYYKTIPCYLALFVLAEIFELLMAFDALRLRNVIQLIGILIFHAALIFFAALQIHETKAALVRLPNCDGTTDYVECGGHGTLYRKVEHLLIAAPITIGVAWVILIFFVRALYDEFGWAIFRVVGANRAKKTMYQFYQVLVCLLKFDFFAFTGVTIQLLILVLSKNSAEFGVTIIAIPVVLVLLIGCGFAVQREIKSLMVFSLFLMLASETYFIYKLVRFYEPSSESQYQTTRATLTLFTIVSMLLLLTTFGFGLKCFADFGKDLYDCKNSDTLLQKRKIPVSIEDGEKPDSSHSGGYPLEQRLSIE